MCSSAPPSKPHGMMRRTYLLAGAAGIAAVALSVGLGVGLSRTDGDAANRSSQAATAGDFDAGGVSGTAGGDGSGGGAQPVVATVGTGTDTTTPTSPPPPTLAATLAGGMTTPQTAENAAAAGTATTTEPAATTDTATTDTGTGTPNQTPPPPQQQQQQQPPQIPHVGPPNILLLYSDQHQGAALGAELHPDILTPNLDALASDGVRFSRAYVNDGICAPSRISFMSGLYPRTLGALDNSLHPVTRVQKEAYSLAETLRDAGDYTTAAIGKRHLGTQAHKGLDDGWDVHYSHRLGRDKEGTYYNWIQDLGVNDNATADGEETTYLEEFMIDRNTCDEHDLCTQQSSLPPDKTMEAWTSMKSIDYLKEHAQNARTNAARGYPNETKPFFLWSTFFRPHQPYNPQPRFEALYTNLVANYTQLWGRGLRHGGTIAKPSNLEQPSEDLPRGLRKKRETTKPPWNCLSAQEDHQLYRNYMAAYYALVTEIDHYVGEIVQTLKAQGLSDNTVVIYTSDHGDFVGRHGLASKVSPSHTTYEEIYRVPLIVKYPPRVRQRGVVHDLTQAIDMYPTILELAGIPDKGDDGYPLQGKSLVPTLSPLAAPTRTDYIVAENWDSMTIITERYKLTKWLSGNELHPEESHDFSDNPHLLFNRSHFDGVNEGQLFPLETVNLYYDEEYEGVRDELLRLLEEWVKETDDSGREEKYENYRRRMQEQEQN